ncbi:hypothetical protein NLU13_8882 [Sarocladium strictum]|uniref:Asl1-like glycosyl hydrolase catalytic domain-containing protein n=1 Tax=Sarocladium strictum TaxID=5046 RepID=A0AA39L3E5_SARSR|nr:hypothetical protein NLU13_8882 [Sarocladium strictum]
MKFIAALALASIAAGLPAKKGKVGSTRVSGNFTVLDTDAPGGIKKGLAYNDANLIGILAREGSASWAYNWGAALDAPQFQGIPMCWGAGVDCDVNGINEKLDRGDTPWVLGYNEPDMPRDAGGSLLTPQQAYDAWGNDMFRFQERGAKLVCPGISSYDTDVSTLTGFESGLTWLRRWATWTNNPGEFRCDAQALHWYGVEGQSGADQGGLFIQYIDQAHNTVNEIFGREMDIWITEFAPLPIGDVGVLAEFLRTVIPWLNQQAWVARYSPFMAENLVSDGDLNDAGRAFVETV